MKTDIVDRLRGRYAMGPHLPNGNPEFGWRQFDATPINLEAADYIEMLRARLELCDKTNGTQFADMAKLYDDMAREYLEALKEINELKASRDKWKERTMEYRAKARENR
jgi:hypothetical protein